VSSREGVAVSNVVLVATLSFDQFNSRAAGKRASEPSVLFHEGDQAISRDF